jgi:hypothetical protein
MTKEQWQTLYDDLFYIRHQFNKCYYDVFENTDISKKQTNEREIEMKNFMSSAYYKIQFSPEALKLFGTERNINDLKFPDHFEYNLTPFLYDIKTHINNLD